MKPNDTSDKMTKLSEPVLGVIISISAFLIWILINSFGPLSESAPLRITLVSAGNPVPDATVSVYFIAKDEKPSVGKSDENGECSLSWQSGSDKLVSIKVTKNSDVLFDELVRVPWQRKLRLTVDKTPAPKTGTN